MTNNPFNIIPAVDLLDGQVVRLFRGDYDQSTVYGDDPGEPIEKFIEAGAELIHIVDLNAARNGDRSVNEAAVERILTVAGKRARLEIGGGIRDLDSLSDYLGRGIARCILGTAAVNDPEFLKKSLAAHGPEKVIVGIDARDGRVRVDGWEKDSGVNVADFLKEMEKIGIGEIIFTDILTDGAMTGPAIGSLKEVLTATSTLRLIASGGISSLDDVQALLDLKEPRLVGAISGRAIYEGKLDVQEAVNLCRDAVS